MIKLEGQKDAVILNLLFFDWTITMQQFFAHEVLKHAAIATTLVALREFVRRSNGELQAPEQLAKIEQTMIRSLGIPPQFELGQVALPCFAFAKEFKRSPADIATELAAIIASELTKAPGARAVPEMSLVASAAAAGGFLNFTADFSALGAVLLPVICDGSLFKKPLHGRATPEHIVVEYSQPNTHKAMHVGHLRGLILGDAVCKILAAVGHRVARVTYPGDLGAHIAKTLWYLKQHHHDPVPVTHRGDWLGDLYATAHSFVEESSQDPERAATIKSEIGGVLAELQHGSGPYYDLWLETREWSFAEMRAVYDWMKVTFDEWFTESECDAPSRELVLEKEREGLFVRDQGAIGIDLSPYKLGFALLLKTDGNGLYLTKDLELIRRKFKDPSVTRSIVVVDARQKLHFRQVFKIAELMGYPQATASAHLDYETVNTADGKKAFSSRTKNGMKLAHLREMMEAKVKTDYLERYRNNWTDAEIDETAAMVAVGAIKYGMLKVDNSTQVNFDLDEWLRLDGDTGPYLQYVHARCLNILEKQASQGAAAGASAPAHFVAQEIAAQELMVHLSRYFDALKQAAELLRPAFVATYLFELAKMFNRFYEQCSIKDSEGDVRESRLALVRATARVMEHGLSVLGIEAPRRM